MLYSICTGCVFINVDEKANGSSSLLENLYESTSCFQFNQAQAATLRQTIDGKQQERRKWKTKTKLIPFTVPRKSLEN